MKMISRIDQKGFILFITMIMLLIFAIVAIGMYQQTSVLTKNIQQDLFKKQAEAVSMQVLKDIESSFPESIPFADISTGITSFSGVRPMCAPGTVGWGSCDPIPNYEVEEVVECLRRSHTPPMGWVLKSGITVGGNVTGNVMLAVQQLGADEEDKYFTFRTTVISSVLTAQDAISSTFVIPIVK